MKTDNRRRRIVWDFLFPLVILTSLTAVFWVTDADITLEKLFYTQEFGWLYKGEYFVHLLYNYGYLPALWTAVGALLVLIGSFWVRGLFRYRKAALFCVLLMLLGPGLVVNGIFKDTWGRPRPRQTDVFSGQEKFLYVWEKGPNRECHSFPSGHASMGFFFFFPFFLFRRRSKGWAASFLCLGLGFGGMIGLGRMMQGGHFASDVLWSAGFVYLCGLALCYLLGLDRDILFGPRDREGAPP
jgi:lipid A 4'-phosphatase